MFDERDFISFWPSRKGYKLMYDRATALESADRNNYGKFPVPIVFFDSFDKRGIRNIISKTPFGKIIFPGPEITRGLETGVLYRDLCLRHQGSHCVTTGNDYRTLEYWKEILNGRKIQAIKVFRAAAGYGLRESKNIMDGDWKIVWGANIPRPDPNFQHNFKPSINHLDPSFDYQQKLNDVEKSARHYLMLSHDLERKVDHLEDELAKTLNLLVDEIEKNKNQPQPINNKFNFNIWEIIECKPNDDYDIIYSSVKNAIQLYHPDKVNRCGVLLQEISTEITTQLLLFRKQLRR